MQLTNQRLSVKSRCLYCGSSSYGKGCRFGPHGVHFHPNDAKKCSYCGSGNYGRGCKLNPTSDLHVHGINYNSMISEQTVQSFIEHKVLIHELRKKFEDFECYKLGIIDKNGNKIKNPITEQELNSFTPMVKTILKLKKYLGPKIDLLDAVNDLKINSVEVNEDIVQYAKINQFSKKIQTILNSLYETLDEAYGQGLTLEQIKNLIKA